MTLSSAARFLADHRRVLRPMVAILVVGAIAFASSPAVAESRRSQEWFLDELSIPQAHKISTGNGVTVAVIDSGVDASHPDLVGHVLKGIDLHHSFRAQYGWRDDSGHGTAMAGIIAAQGGGASHAYGIAPGAKVLPIKVPDDVVTQHILAVAIRWATSHDADVINISLSLNQSENSEEIDAIRYALNHDVVVVAGAGNVDNGGHRIWQPANIPGVVAVTGTSRHGEFWPGSASGPAAVIAAPADGIVSTDSRIAFPNGYSEGHGTSASSAIVSGVAALVRSRYPRMDAANVVNRLINTATDKGDPGRDPKFGYGIVDPVGALNASVPVVLDNPLGDPDVVPSRPWWSPRASNFGDEHPGYGVAISLSAILLLTLVALASRVFFRRRDSARFGTLHDSNREP